MTEWMPPLPEPNGYMRETPVWAEDELRQAQADAARAALEQVVNMCDEYLTAEGVRCAVRELAKEIT